MVKNVKDIDKLNKKEPLSKAQENKFSDEKDRLPKINSEVSKSKNNRDHNLESLESIETTNEKESDIESELKQEIEILKDEKLRLLADMENLRKRSEKDKIDSIKYGNINLARDILSLSDNLSKALDFISINESRSKSINNLIDGLKMVKKEFITILKKHGVERIESMKKKFDYNYHQAMFEIETDEFDEGIVVQEIQNGYTMHNRLLRPSMVGVSKKPENKKKNTKKV